MRLRKAELDIVCEGREVTGVGDLIIGMVSQALDEVVMVRGGLQLGGEDSYMVPKLLIERCTLLVIEND